MGSELGIVLAVAAGLMVGNCMLPLNYLRKWRWENAWIIFTLVALVLVPWTLAFLRVPNLLSVYSNVNSASFMIPLLFGAGWGVAQVLFGLAVIRAGMALSFAITIGLSAALGSLVPILLRHPQALVTGRGLVLLLGQLLMVTGVVVCCWAGRRREREQKADAATATDLSGADASAEECRRADAIRFPERSVPAQGVFLDAGAGKPGEGDAGAGALGSDYSPTR